MPSSSERVTILSWPRGAHDLDKFRKRWDELVSIVDGAQFDGAISEIADGGAILVRPDGFVGFHADLPMPRRWGLSTLISPAI
jgi:hypothetical protein